MARMAFGLEVFPQLSETFVLEQIRALADLGREIEIVADHFLDQEGAHSPFAVAMATKGRMRLGGSRTSLPCGFGRLSLAFLIFFLTKS